MNPSVLVVDDDQDTLDSLTELLSRKKYRTLAARSIKEAKELLSQESADAILLDEKLPDGSGIAWVPELRDASPRMAIVVITGLGDIPTAVKAMRDGADDFLTKPIRADELLLVLERSLEREHLKLMDHLRSRLDRKETIFVGQALPAKRMWDLARKAADNQAAVLLQGETGVGKGIVARWIHENGQRKSQPFVEVNCSSMRGDLLSSELLGHRKGAFTSAIECREGLLELADGGTLFLDEIGDMDLGVQAQFLKVIEEKKFRRVGESKNRSSDFRLVCATNRNLSTDSEEGRFRRDLFFRIYVFPIELPPLRSCRNDIPALVSVLLAGIGHAKQTISPDGMECLMNYGWPGNIREFRNILERACLIAEGKPLGPEHLFVLAPHASHDKPAVAEVKVWHMDSMEEKHIQDALTRFEGDVNKTAHELGISRATMYRKLKKYHMLRPGVA